jgi:hypothetical protein
MASTASGAVKQKPVVEPPTEPFINLSGDGPVDPTKFQRFIIPMEFIQKANSVELPGLDPDDLRDTGEQSPMDPSNSPSPLLPNARTDAHSPVTPPPATIARPPDKSEVPTLRELQTTTKMVARRPLGPFAQWSLTGKMPTGAKVVIAVIVALVCVLILTYTHLKSSENSIRSVGPAIPEFAASPTQSPNLSVVALPSGVLPQSGPISARQTQVESDAPDGEVGMDSKKKPSGRALPRSKATSLQSATETAKPQATASPAATASASPRRKGSFWTPIDSVD